MSSISEVNFSYSHYQNTLQKYLDEKYQFIKMSEVLKYLEKEKIFILRHDVDKSVKKALDLAKIEHQFGINATYYLRLHSNYYNPFGYIVQDIVKQIRSFGHEIGLHTEFLDFSEILGESAISTFEKEIAVFQTIFGEKPKTYSFHRTTGATDIETLKKFSEEIFDKFGIIGSYDRRISENFKYLSDSSGIWREGCFSQHIGKHNKMQVLIHAEWWFEKNINLEESLV
jgi:hypothetical protein